MAITKKEKATPAAAPAAVAPAGPVLLELTNVDRYVWRGVLYTKGVIYSASPAEAQTFLAHEEDGKAVFKVYVKRAERPKVDQIPTVAIPQPKTTPVSGATVSPGKIELATPEEEKELGLPAEDGPVTEV